MREKILSAIKTGRVQMRPRWHFVLKAALFAIGLVIAVLALLYIGSFIIFGLRQTGILFIPAFGSRGWLRFLAAMPWTLIALSAAFIVILEILVRHYSFGFRQPLLYTIAAIMILVILGGVAVERTRIHRILSDYSQGHALPFAGALYNSLRDTRISDVHRGRIDTVSANAFEMTDRRGELFNVRITLQTRLFSGEALERGEYVVVFGPDENGVINAYGIMDVGME